MKTYTIKPLEWKDESSDVGPYFIACPIHEIYAVYTPDGAPESWFWSVDDPYSEGPCDSLAHGKALCEQEYRRRLEACLVEVCNGK